jgi:hypothetical protein
MSRRLEDEETNLSCLTLLGEKKTHLKLHEHVPFVIFLVDELAKWTHLRILVISGGRLLADIACVKSFGDK